MPVTPSAPNIEYALLVDHADGSTETVPAVSAEHASRMAQTIYAGYSAWVVGRPVNPWQYVQLGTAQLLARVL